MKSEVIQVYEVDGKSWRVSRFDLLEVEFEGITNDALAGFHEVQQRHPRAWIILRRLFGIQPMVPLAEDPENCRVWGRRELCENMGITPKQLGEEIGVARARWQRAVAPEPETELEPAPGPDPEAPPGELDFEGTNRLLARHGFPEALFRTPGASDEDVAAEMEWFAGRVRDFSKLLEHRLASSLARQTLLSELQLRRIETHMTQLHVGGKNYIEVLRAKDGLQKTYADQLAQIDKIAPWMGAVAGKMNFTGVVSDLVRSYQEYYARDSNRLIDGIFTATEVQVLLRRHTHMEQPRYRAGLVAYLNAARESLFDPRWRAMFSQGQLRKLDAAWADAHNRVAELDGEKPTDLESDDPAEGEYPPLFTSDAG